MKKYNKLIKAIGLAIVISVSGCASNYESKEGSMSAVESVNESVSKAMVLWQPEALGELNALEEIDDKKLTQKIKESFANEPKLFVNQKVQVSIKKVHPIRPWINWVSTAFILVPLDRGGMDVDVKVMNEHNQVVYEGQQQIISPVVDFGMTHYQSHGPIEKVSEEFAKLLDKQLKQEAPIKGFALR